MTTIANGPLSFGEIDNATTNDNETRPPAEKITAKDGVQLNVHVYRPKLDKPTAALLFYHGGGAHSLAGYQHIGNGLSSDDYNMVVYMPDLRGHGLSGGPRGDSPSAEQVFQDINTVLEHIMSKEGSSIKIFLGGHSSGGGLTVNYATWNERITSIEGYVLVSPELGYLSKTARPDRQEFAKVKILPFILNGIFGVLGHNKAVQFQYPDEALEKYGLVAANTVNMANAITPTSPKEQFNKVNLPLGLWVGSEDELFVPEAVAEYATGVERADVVGTVVPGANHLGILVHTHQSVGPWLVNCMN